MVSGYVPPSATIPPVRLSVRLSICGSGVGSDAQAVNLKGGGMADPILSDEERRAAFRRAPFRFSRGTIWVAAVYKAPNYERCATHF